MGNETDMENVRIMSKTILNAVDVVCDNDWGILQHPFANSTFAMDDNGEILNITEEDDCKKWIKKIEKQIDNFDLDRIFHVLINKPWKLTWLKFVRPSLSNEDFSRLFAQAWIESENPNADANVSISTLIKWFKEADKKVLMTEEEYEYWSNLPDEVVLYRGVSRGRNKYGLSWTDDEKTARWFQKRFATEKESGCLLKVTVSKKYCLCYLNSRDEKEIVLDVNAVKKDIKTIE